MTSSYSIRLYAQPYTIEANGFYFDSAEEFVTKSAANKDRFGAPVEEYEIQFIDGERLDCELSQALGLNQANYASFFEIADEWDEYTKIRFIIANGECGYYLAPIAKHVEDIDLDIYEVPNLETLAEQFVDEGLFGEVPKAFENYIDFGKIARDLSVDYATTTIDNRHFAYRCG